MKCVNCGNHGGPHQGGLMDTDGWVCHRCALVTGDTWESSRVDRRLHTNPDQTCEVCGYTGEGILCSQCMAIIGCATPDALMTEFEKAMSAGKIDAADWFGQLIEKESVDYERIGKEGERTDADRGSSERGVGDGVPRGGQADAGGVAKEGNAVHGRIENTQGVFSFGSFGVAGKKSH